MPPSMLAMWQAFCDLDGGRTLHAAGPNPITWPDMIAWSRLTHTPLGPLDVAAIRAVDRAYLAAQATK